MTVQSKRVQFNQVTPNIKHILVRFTENLQLMIVSEVNQADKMRKILNI